MLPDGWSLHLVSCLRRCVGKQDTLKHGLFVGPMKMGNDMHVLHVQVDVLSVIDFCSVSDFWVV
jgi:hypothetical protein